MVRFFAAALLALSGGAKAFAPGIVRPQHTTFAPSGICRMSEEPSDVSDSYDNDPTVVNVDSQPYKPTETEALVNNVLDLFPSTLGDASAETRAAINEALYKLEAENPTDEPAMSALLNGVWELKYVGGYSPDWALSSPTRQLALFLYSGGYSPGIFALGLAQKLPSNLVSAGDLEITINRDQPRVEAKVGVKYFGGSESSVAVTARLEVESDIRLRETYESATVFDNAVDIPANVQYDRELYVTYLDDDLLVVREASGIPEVLVRKDFF